METLVLKNENALLKGSSNEQIRAYFEKVLELSKSDEKFPVDLDEVWPLVYVSRHKAVSALKESFIERYDYILLTQSGEQKSRGGHNRINYKLSISCMEYLIVKKVRPVFEIYRKVFHNSTKKAAIDSAMIFYEGAARILNLNENSKLIMMKKVANVYGFDLSALPEYTKSVDTLLPLSKILEGTGISARCANPILEAKSILVKKWRKSSSGKQVTFWNIKPEYFHLGENQVSPQNPRETQPMWYESKRDTIVSMIKC